MFKMMTLAMAALTVLALLVSAGRPTVSPTALGASPPSPADCCDAPGDLRRL